MGVFQVLLVIFSVVFITKADVVDFNGVSSPFDVTNYTSAVDPVEGARRGGPRVLVDGEASHHRKVRLHKSMATRRRSVDHVHFALRLYDILSAAKGHENENVAFSPLSVSSVLYILLEGANGTTATEIQLALEPSSSSNSSNEGSASVAVGHRRRLSAIYEQIAKLSLPSSDGVSLGLVNRLFAQSGQQFLRSFARNLEMIHRTKTRELDFERDPDSAEKTVNEWVSESTRGRIQTLIPPGTFDFQTRLVIVNALFFKGDWMTQFDARRTRLMPFYLEGRRARFDPSDDSSLSVDVVTMFVEADLPYRDFRRLKFEMLELPYVNDEVSMFVVLPHEESSLAQVTRHLLKRPSLLANPRLRLSNGTVSVFLPKFHLEENIDLKRALLSLGVRRAFEQGKADLSGMDGKREMYVSDAFHKVSVEVDEKGSKAAAASGLVIKGRSMNHDPVFRANRPFLFFIRHNPTSSVLFFGHVKRLKDATGSLSTFHEDAVVI